jgi:hypothetical protein
MWEGFNVNIWLCMDKKQKCMQNQYKILHCLMYGTFQIFFLLIMAFKNKCAIT